MPLEINRTLVMHRRIRLFAKMLRPIRKSRRLSWRQAQNILILPHNW